MVATSTAVQTNVIDRLVPEWQDSWLKTITLMVVGSVLLALSSKLQIPMPPVPFTMQSYVVLVLGMAMGARLAGMTVLLYLFEGAMGLPVFSSGGGLPYFLGPTGGYLIGFLIAATAVGYLADKGMDKNVWRASLAMAVGTALLFIPGVLWLAYLFDWQTALATGLFPFWFGMIAKLLLGAVTLPLAWQLVGRKR